MSPYLGRRRAPACEEQQVVHHAVGDDGLRGHCVVAPVTGQGHLQAHMAGRRRQQSAGPACHVPWSKEPSSMWKHVAVPVTAVQVPGTNRSTGTCTAEPIHGARSTCDTLAAIPC